MTNDNGAGLSSRTYDDLDGSEILDDQTARAFTEGKSNRKDIISGDELISDDTPIPSDVQGKAPVIDDDAMIDDNWMKDQ